MKITWKSVLSAFLAFTLLLGIGAAGIAGVYSLKAYAAEPEVFQEGVYYYTVTDGKAKITNVIGIYGDVTLPSTLGGYPVTGIGNKAVQSEGQLVNVVIPSSIETVETSAFTGCDMLETVTFEDNSKLKILGETAFSNCKALKSVDFGENSVLESIGTSAFVNCSSLNGIEIPDSVKTIGATAFEGCVKLGSVTIPASVTDIGIGAFANCESLEKITVDASNPNYSSDSRGIVYNKEKTKIVTYPAGNKRTVYIIPSHITEVERSAFKGAKYIEELTWTNSDMEIGISAFSYCTGLYRVTIPEGVTYLKDWMFNACFSLKEINFPESLEAIGSGVFHWCTSLEHVELPSGLKILYNNAFNECTGLKSIVLPDGLKEISPTAFQKCYSLESIDIPESVGTIGSSAFYQCFSLKEFAFPEGIKYINDDVLRYCFALENIKLPESTKKVYAGAFEDCRSLKTLSLPKNVNEITGEVFVNCTAFESVTVDEENNYFSAARNGILFNKDKTKLVYYPANKAATVYTVPDTVTKIGAFAFCNAQNTAAIVIPDSVSAIEAKAFSGFNIRDIYFEGTQEEWEAFAVAADTLNAQLHFNYNGTDHVHDYSQKIITEATCDANGKKSFTCSCGESSEAEYHNGTGKKMCLGGNYEWIDGSASDCAQMGKMAYCCSECGYQFYRIDVAKDMHSLDATVSDSKIDYICSECGYTYSETISSDAGYVVFKTEAYEKAYVYGYGDKISVPADPQKDGFDFVGWKDESGAKVDLTQAMPERNLILSPMFNATFESDAYGVTATFDEDCFESDVNIKDIKLKVNEVDGNREPGAVYINNNPYQPVNLYNIKIVNVSDESPVTPRNGKTVKIRVPVPEEYKDCKSFFIEHRLSSTPGKREYFTNNPQEFSGISSEVKDLQIENGFLVFEVSCFSEFEVYAKAPTVRLINTPSKTSYIYKEGNIDLSGIALEITNADGSTETVTDTSKMKVSGFDSAKVGEQTVTVEYEGDKVEFKVTVAYAWWQWIIRILLLGFLWY